MTDSIPATEPLSLPLSRLELHLIGLLAARDEIDGEEWVRRMLERGTRSEIDRTIRAEVSERLPGGRA